MGDAVEISPAIFPEVLDRLSERRLAVEKEVKLLGEPPRGLKDIAELCRGFERAFAALLASKPVDGGRKQDGLISTKIKDAFLGDKGLAGTIKALQGPGKPLEQVFDLETVRRVCKQADGYQPHLVSPEKGLRLLASESLDLVMPAVKNCVGDVYNLLVEASRDAADAAGEFTEAALSGCEPMRLPSFKNMIMPAVIQSLDDWRDEAIKMCTMLVEMEKTYITAGFFRFMAHKRIAKLQRQATMQAQQASRPMTKAMAGFKTMFNRPPAPAPSAAVDENGQPRDGSPSPADKEAAPRAPNEPDRLMAYLDKLASDSGRTALPLEAWKWQKRFFVYLESDRTLYYFRNQEDLTKPNGLRGQVLMSECVVEDLDERGNPRVNLSRSTGELDRNASMLFRIKNKDPRQGVFKDHNTVVLRAENMQQKLEWLTKLARAGGSGRAHTPVRDAPAPINLEAKKAAPTPPPQSQGVNAHPPADLDDDSGNEHEDGVDYAKYFDGGEGGSSSMDLIDTHTGQGSSMFRADSMRDAEGRLMPAPNVVLAASSSDNMRRGGNAYQARYDQLMQQFGQDMAVYMRMVCDTIINTVPKGVVHCLVRKSEQNMLNRLFQYVHDMGDVAMEQLLTEDPNLVSRRSYTKQLVKELDQWLAEVHTIQENYNRSVRDGSAPGKVTVDGQLLAFAGLTSLIPQEQRAHARRMLDSEFAPRLLAIENDTPLRREKSLPAPAPAAPAAAPGPDGQGTPQPRRAAPSAPGGAAAPLARPSVQASDASLMTMSRPAPGAPAPRRPPPPPAAAAGNGLAPPRPPPAVPPRS